MLQPPPPPAVSREDSSSGGESQRSFSYSPSILIIAAILAFVIAAIASIHLLLRFLSRSRSTPFDNTLSSSSTSTTPSSSMTSPSSGVIDSLPLFSLSSVAAAKPSSSLDCAVCLSPFEPRDELRLLPSCRHAFHSHCIDTWLRSTPSCPLCRSSIASTPPPPASIGSSESFRLEVASLSRRTESSADESTSPAPAHVRTLSPGSSFEYLVEEDVESVLARIRQLEKSGDGAATAPPPPPPGSAVAEMVGGSRSWLREYVDQLASSASSSFSSLRRSRRFDSGASTAAFGGGGVGGEWDLERNLHLHLEEEDGGFSSFYRWLVGA